TVWRRRHDHIRGLEIAVYDARAMCGGERGAELLRDLRGVSDIQGAAASQVRRQRLAVQQLHGEKVERQCSSFRLVLMNIMDPADIRMGDLLGGMDLAHEARKG